MSHLADSFAVAASGMQAQAKRLRHVSENIANADTPGFRRKTVEFRAVSERPSPGQASGAAVRVGPVRLDGSEQRLIYDPGHALADETGHFRGSNVDLIIEVADAREAQRGYEANLRMFDQTRQMAQGLLELLRR